MTDAIDALLSAWASAEHAGDVDRLESLLRADFCAVGPLGFILRGWLARHRSGDLGYETFELDELQTRQFGEVAVSTAHNTTIGTYRGDPIPEAVRVPLVAVSTADGWRLAHVHMSFVAGTRAAPPIPGSGR